MVHTDATMPPTDSPTSPNDPRRNTAEEVARLHDMGWSVRRIAKSLDISTQRVYQILTDLRESA